jgi:hypothetical protein
VPQNTEKIDSVSDYLKIFHLKILKEKGETKVESQNAVELLMEQTENFNEDAADVDNGDSQDQPENVHKTKTATKQQMEEISKALGADWEKKELKLI